MAVLRVPTLSMIDAHTIATFMVANRCAVLLSANQMIPHAIPQADDDPRRRSEHCKAFLNVSCGMDSHVDTLMPIVGSGAAGIILYPQSTVTIHVLLNEAVHAKRTGDREAQLKGNGWSRHQDQNQERSYQYAAQP